MRSDNLDIRQPTVLHSKIETLEEQLHLVAYSMSPQEKSDFAAAIRGQAAAKREEASRMDRLFEDAMGPDDDVTSPSTSSTF